ncbi:glomulin [Agrilus planipennis]|uniref:Glomulin n=1 Tax=Agrilus planipennis TaxID=224129 RepID=A0A7F5RLP9_AGRPL|nr:glomulin [Agrilus planipennis]
MSNSENLELIKLLQKRLELEDYKGAQTIVTNYDYKCLKEEDYEQFVTFFMKYLNEDVEKKNITLFLTSKSILCVVSTWFNPETVIIELIQKIPELVDDLSFLSLLVPLQKALLGLHTGRDSFLTWSLNSIQKYIEKLDIPDDNYNLDEEERLLMDSDDSFDKTTHLLLDLLPFYDPLIKKSINDEAWRLILSVFLVKLLGKPLAYFDLTSTSSKSRARRIAEEVVEKYINIEPDIYLLLGSTKYPENEENICCNKLAVAVLFYLILVEHVSIEKIPKVYDHLFVFQYSLHLLVELFTQTNQFATQYALELTNTLLNYVQNISLPYNLLDDDVHCNFCKSLSKVTIYDTLESNRKKALLLLTKYLYTFEIRGRYLIIYNLVDIVNHTGLISFLITEYKQMLVKELDKIKDENKEISQFFSGQKLNSLINKFCYLHKREESDLVELADQIVASLNFLRYLIIRDRDNVTKIWDILPRLETTYFEPLKKGLVLSRAHYELKIKEINEEKEDCKATSNNEVSITVGKQTLPSMPKSEKLKVLHSSVTAFDVIESVLSRVKELINTSNFLKEDHP